MTTPTPNLRRNRWLILVIVLICFVPFALAWYLAKNPQWIESRAKTNYGHLVVPARPFGYAELFQNPVTPAETLQEIKGRWVLVQVASGGACSDLCEETAYKTGQLRLMLNKEIPRVRRLLLLQGTLDVTSVEGLSAADPTLLIAGLPDPLRQRFQATIGAPLVDGTVLILDPFGNVMMWYEPGFDPYGVLRDLQRLLKVSQIG